MENSNEYLVFGIPGAGKTTYLQKSVEQAANRLGGHNIVVSSFTRAAAAELSGRDLPIPAANIGTLHSLCYRALGNPEIAETHVKEFNYEHPDYALSKSKKSLDEPETDQVMESKADKSFAELQVLRAQMVPEEKWPLDVQAFNKAWRNWKYSCGYLDFTDLIEEAFTSMPFPPNNATVGIFDEAQDFTPLQIKLIRSWAEKLSYLMIAGDDDQCQPEGTMVLTQQGYKKIEDLKPESDRLITYSKNDAQCFGFKNGYRFKKISRYYRDLLYQVNAGDCVTQCTKNHLWLAKWTEEAKSTNTHCVYLMQQGNRFRVGWCKLFRSDGCMHLNVRANIEKAERVWILQTFGNKHEAAWYKSYIATEYGLPLVVFNGGDTRMQQEGIEYIFSRLDSDIQMLRATVCLKDHGRSLEYPLIDRTKPQNVFGARVMEIRTCNMIDGLMSIPVFEGAKSVRWKPVRISAKDSEGIVYSLNVEKYCTYIADHLVTHNCLYGFTGADPHVFLDAGIPNENKRYLTRSYRVPNVIQRHAQMWIERITKREPKEQHPKIVKGTDEIVQGKLSTTSGSTRKVGPIMGLIEMDLQQDREVMVLASCSYMLQPLIKELRKQGIPFGNKYRTNRGDWNPLRTGGKSTADRIMAFLEPEGPTFGGVKLWSMKQLALWVEICQAGRILKRGKKQLLLSKKDKNIGREDYLDLISECFLPEALDQAIKCDLGWLSMQLTSDKAKAAEFPLNVLTYRGKDALTKQPKVQIGTIHSVKGGQSQHVILFPDISMQAAQNADTSREGKASIIRQFYVGMTRASEELTIAEPASRLHVPII